jgi:exosortase/archaeosortase family protein
VSVAVVRTGAFLALFAVLTLAWSSRAAAPAQTWFIERWTVQPAAWLFQRFDAGRGVEADGARLASPAGSVQVLPGCEGADIAFLLASAMLFAPLGWRLRALGLLVGLAWVFVLNQARVVGLVLAAGHDRALFDLLHGTVFPLALVAAVGAFFVGWLALAAPRAAAPAAVPPAE